MDNNNFLKQYYDLWVLLNHTRHVVYRARELELREFDISAEQARLLVLVGELGKNATPTEIGIHALRRSHTISSLVDRMEHKNLVKRMKDPNNKKTVIVTLTANGQKVRTRVLKMECLQRIFSGLSEKDIRQLEKLLKILFKRSVKEIGMDDVLELSPENERST